MNATFYEWKPHLCLFSGLGLLIFVTNNPIAKLSGILLIVAALWIYFLRWSHRKAPPVPKKKKVALRNPPSPGIAKR